MSRPLHRVKISQATRQAIAERHGVKPDQRAHPIACHYCGAPGTATWWPAGTRFHRWLYLPGGRRPLYNATRQIFFSLHLDHVIPLIDGGPNTSDNIVLACEPCNLTKGRQPVDQWQAGRH